MTIFALSENLDFSYSFDYNKHMYRIKTTPEFDQWIAGLKDRSTIQRLNVRLRKATLGNLGDVKPVGNGIFEMREHFGPGWRMYYEKRGSLLIVMLGGGAKSTQSTDIAKAMLITETFEETT